MITNCTRCGRAVVIARKEYNPKKKLLCKHCEGSGLMTRIFAGVKSIFTPKPTRLGLRPA